MAEGRHDAEPVQQSRSGGKSQDILDLDYSDANEGSTTSSVIKHDKVRDGINEQCEGGGDDLDEASRLRALGAGVQDQDDLERNIGRQAGQLLAEQANEREQKRLEKTRTEKAKLQSQIRRLQSKLNQPCLPAPAAVLRMQGEIDHYLAQIESLDQDARDIEDRMKEHQNDLQEFRGQKGDGGRMPGESQRDFLIRTGKITPFSRLAQPVARATASLREALFDAEQNRPDEEEEPDVQTLLHDQRSHRHLLRPGLGPLEASNVNTKHTALRKRPRKRRKIEAGRAVATSSAEFDHVHKERESDGSECLSDMFNATAEDKEPLEISSEEEEEFQPDLLTKRPKRNQMSLKRSTEAEREKEDLSNLDDGNEDLYQIRLKSWVERRSSARTKELANSAESRTFHNDHEWHLPHPTKPDWQIDHDFKLPGDIHPALFDYQKTGVQWLWELYSQQVGGIVGDEMGLGKTIQIISFLAGLHYSRKITKPVIIVCPATVMKQWVNEFHLWWPAFRVSILHTSGSGMIDVGRESRREEELLNQAYSRGNGMMTKAAKAAQEIVNRVVDEGHILVTTYSGLQKYAEHLIPVDWEVAVLDEGHKIRNPNASITIHCKELRTSNRIILSGTPMQNNLIELWSLFDFVYPMRLGTLVSFRAQFEIPIRQGGYANASNLQVQTASKCAETLKDSIAPYLLRRLKLDVASDLPRKTEQVLFCKLTRQQREAYEDFLKSEEMQSIATGKRQMLYGIDILRKICNHPDLASHKQLSIRPGYNYGVPQRSGKMMVLKELLDIWTKSGHKTLLFAQYRIMLDILEAFIKSMPSINCQRMDGTTPIPVRQKLVDEFNDNPNLHVFLLTTKVGGLGVNLTGADRVIIYDPDWNPSTDIQARERAWRLGQKREVQIYRLMMAGTIEEKIFQRQIFKQLLTNKILKDPKQRQTFQMKDLHDLFTLGSEDENGTETGKIFKGTETHIRNEDGDRLTRAWSRTTPPPIPPEVEPNNSLKDIRGIAAIRPQEDDGAQLASIEAGESARENRIMASIFARSGVSSTLEHDQIINGKKVLAADPKIIEKEAKRVAAEAAKTLRKAESVAKTTPVGVPTWTGQFGQAGRSPSPPARSRFGIGIRSGRGGPSSAGILAGLQSHSVITSESTSSTSVNRLRPGARVEKDERAKGAEFARLIRDYLVSHGGKVYTQMLIDHFNRHCTTTERTAEFKHTLREIARLEKGVGGRGKWVLKDEYKMQEEMLA